MDERKLRGIFAQYNSFKERAEDLLESCWSLENLLTDIILKIPYHQRVSSEVDIKHRLEKFHDEVKMLIGVYNNSLSSTSKEVDILLNIISSDGSKSSLHQLIIECNKIIGILDEEITGLSREEMDNVPRLKKEIAEICDNLDPHFEKNLNEGVIELEKGHFLASVLITSRVVDYTLKHIKGEAIEEKINNLIEIGVFDKEHKMRQQVFV